MSLNMNCEIKKISFLKTNYYNISLKPLLQHLPMHYIITMHVTYRI